MSSYSLWEDMVVRECRTRGQVPRLAGHARCQFAAPPGLAADPGTALGRDGRHGERDSHGLAEGLGWGGTVGEGRGGAVGGRWGWGGHRGRERVFGKWRGVPTGCDMNRCSQIADPGSRPRTENLVSHHVPCLGETSPRTDSRARSPAPPRRVAPRDSQTPTEQPDPPRFFCMLPACLANRR